MLAVAALQSRRASTEVDQSIQEHKLVGRLKDFIATPGPRQIHFAKDRLLDPRSKPRLQSSPIRDPILDGAGIDQRVSQGCSIKRAYFVQFRDEHGLESVD